MKRKTLSSIPFIRQFHSILSLLCFFILFPGLVFAEPLKINNFIKEIGPLKVDDKSFSIVVNLQKIVAPSVVFNETIESFEIKDSQGRTCFRKKFPVSLGVNGFTEEFGVSGHAVKGENGQGLILYYSIEPSAPSAGRFCQIFSLDQERLIPLSSALTCYGKIVTLPREPSSHSLRLFEGNVIKFNVWTGQFGVEVPFSVNWNEKNVKPIISEGYFNVKAEKRLPQEGPVQLLSKPIASVESTSVKVKSSSNIILLKAYAEIVMETYNSPLSEIHITVQNPWLKVSVDKVEGWISNWRELNTIGLPPAG